MFSKYYTLKTKGKKNMSDSTECLFDNDVTKPEQELNEKMLDLSLTSKQPQLKQDIDDEISVEDTQAAKEMANNHETPMAPDFTNNFQHDTSNSLYNTSEKRVYHRCINQSKSQLRGMISWIRGSQMLSNGNLNHNFSYESYQRDLSMRYNATESRNFKGPKDKSYKKSRRDIIRSHYHFFKGRHTRDRTFESTLLLPRESQM